MYVTKNLRTKTRANIVVNFEISEADRVNTNLISFLPLSFRHTFPLIYVSRRNDYLQQIGEFVK
jgi:hypothetical protein